MEPLQQSRGSETLVKNNDGGGCGLNQFRRRVQGMHAARKAETLGALEYPAKPFNCNGLLVTGQDRVFRGGVSHFEFYLEAFRL